MSLRSIHMKRLVEEKELLPTYIKNIMEALAGKDSDDFFYLSSE